LIDWEAEGPEERHELARGYLLAVNLGDESEERVCRR
jgi:hypothetical protein